MNLVRLERRPRRSPDLTANVAIIGGGAAGLSMAKLLAEAGIHDVTVFEARGSAGGKALSITEDGALHELGTCYSTLAHRLTNRWMRELGVRQIPLGRQMFDGKPFQDYLRSGPGAPLAIETARFIGEWWRHARALADRPDAPDVLAECALPIGDWLDARGLTRMRRFMQRALTTMGYGFLDEVATCQALRWCTPTLLATGVTGALKMPQGGWQEFWARIARPLDVRLNEPVTELTREGPGGVLKTPWTICRFAHLILTIPLDDFAALTPLTFDETLVAQSIEWGSYVTSLVRAENWFTAYETDAYSAAVAPGAERGQLLAARRPSRRERRESAGQLYVCGQYGGRPDPELKHLLRADIEARGAHFLAIVQQKSWRYFPRYRADAIRDRLISTMTKMQGHNATWYSGATFSHEAVSNITAFNERLVRRMMPQLAR
jgi:hypothetical protein